MKRTEKITITISIIALFVALANSTFDLIDRVDRKRVARQQFLNNLDVQMRSFFDGYIDFSSQKEPYDKLVYQKRLDFLAKKSIAIAALISRKPVFKQRVVNICLNDMEYRVNTFLVNPEINIERWELAVAEELDQFFNLAGELAVEYYSEAGLGDQRGEKYFLPDKIDGIGDDANSIYHWHCVDRR